MSDGATLLIERLDSADVLNARSIASVLIERVGAPGIPGTGSSSAISRTKIAAQTLSGHRVVRQINGTQIDYADASDVAQGPDVLGIIASSPLAGEAVSVVIDDEITEPGWAWTPLLPIYLTGLGMLTQVPPLTPTVQFQLQVGYALTATSMRVRIGEPVYL